MTVLAEIIMEVLGWSSQIQTEWNAVACWGDGGIQSDWIKTILQTWMGQNFSTGM